MNIADSQDGKGRWKEAASAPAADDLEVLAASDQVPASFNLD
jgi:hypothetical protein